MDEKQLKIGNDLLELIDITKKNLDNLNKWIEESENKNKIGSSYKMDDHYSLCVCKHTDGSGNSLNLSRYYGNTRLLLLIQKELENQIKEFQEDFKKL